MRLYLDDVRPTPEGFDLRAYTAQEAIAYLKAGTVTFISFDHDLGPPEAGTGYDVACWIELAAVGEDIVVPTWDVHSDNPVGRMNIIRAMQSAEKWEQQYID